jgi:prepilin-type processing-associated H-X9-DG protein
MGSSGSPFGPGDDNLFVLWYRRYAKNIDLFSCPGTKYRVRAPEKVEKKPATNGVKYEVTTAGEVDRNDFEHLAQHVDSHGFGTSYEYNVWYNKGNDRPCVDWYWDEPKTWRPDWLGDKLKTVQLRWPNPAYAFLMHDADDGWQNGADILGAGHGMAENNYPEPWDNHGTTGMNILFVDGHVGFVKRHNVQKAWDLQYVRWR